MNQYREWRESRAQFIEDLHAGEEEAVEAGWQRTYVRGENTPIQWLAELRPANCLSARWLGRRSWQHTAASLQRWFIVPVGPQYTEEEITHAVLGVVKTSDYLGIRWHTDPLTGPM